MTRKPATVLDVDAAAIVRAEVIEARSARIEELSRNRKRTEAETAEWEALKAAKDATRATDDLRMFADEYLCLIAAEHGHGRGQKKEFIDGFTHLVSTVLKPASVGIYWSNLGRLMATGATVADVLARVHAGETIYAQWEDVKKSLKADETPADETPADETPADGGTAPKAASIETTMTRVINELGRVSDMLKSDTSATIDPAIWDAFKRVASNVGSHATANAKAVARKG